MPQQVAVSVENNFTKGLITENTGLNFPENAATDTDNCEYTLIGEVLRRLGVDREVSGVDTVISRSNSGVNSYLWNNAGGDGNSKLVVIQIGKTVWFFDASASTVASPLSNNRISSGVDLSVYAVTTFDNSLNCEFSDGNGYLFIFHPNCDPVYVTYSSGTLTAFPITVNIRDFSGIPEPGVSDGLRPSSLSTAHNYNLLNQGWTSGNPWGTNSTSNVTISLGAKAFTVPGGIVGIVAGQRVLMQAQSIIGGTTYDATLWMYGLVSSYVGTTLTINIGAAGDITNPSSLPDWGGPGVGGSTESWAIGPQGTAYLSDWLTAVGNYPSNADQWWRFKNTSGVFSPSTTVANVTAGLGAAPKGHYVMNAFNIDRSNVSAVASIPAASTIQRPSNGCWFQGRVWYTGVNASAAASGIRQFTTWTENIYFSQVVQSVNDFGKCYQTNDPTSETLFDLLPTDGGVIVIQGSGPIYKLFPTQNGLLVFAGNGVWFITGSQGIGFTANDYTVTKISSVRSISSTSFVDVLGLPYFWNEEGIYKVTVSQNGSLSVDPITHTTILNFYADIPLASKKLVRGAYDPIEYVIQWVYRNTDAADTTAAFTLDRALNYSTANQAFFPYTFDTSAAQITSIVYVSGVGGSTAPAPTFKYLTSRNGTVTFADIHDENYVDWAYSGAGVNYVSYLVTGYKIRGQAIKRYQPQYVQVWSNQNDVDSGYKIQGVWDYAIDRNSNRYSGIQLANFDATSYYSVKYKRHKIRGHGYALQIKITSQDGLPFDIIGWAIVDTVNAGT